MVKTACDYFGSMILNQLQVIQFGIHIWCYQQAVQVVRFAGYEGMGECSYTVFC